MKRSTGVIVLFLAIEALLIGGAAFAIHQIRSGQWSAGTQPEAVIARIGEGAGLQLPILGAVFLILWLIIRRSEGRASVPKAAA